MIMTLGHNFEYLSHNCDLWHELRHNYDLASMLFFLCGGNGFPYIFETMNKKNKKNSMRKI